MNSWMMLNLQDASSPIMMEMLFFHDHSMMFIMMITSMTLYLIIFMLNNKFYSYKLNEHQLIEIIWTISPSIILIFLAIPSLKLLYLTDELINPLMTIKIIGNQWYWSYEYTNFNKIFFDSYMIKDIETNSFRLLDVDNNMVIPMKTLIRLIITSNDVIHSFAIPSMAVKVDAIPGRLNQSSIYSLLSGLFFGQCSEICGANHSFMPIVIESTSISNYLNWMENFNM